MIYVHESERPTNFFSPFYRYFIYENTLNINPKDVKDFILNIERLYNHNTTAEKKIRLQVYGSR